MYNKKPSKTSSQPIKPRLGKRAVSEREFASAHEDVKPSFVKTQKTKVNSDVYSGSTKFIDSTGNSTVNIETDNSTLQPRVSEFKVDKCLANLVPTIESQLDQDHNQKVKQLRAAIKELTQKYRNIRRNNRYKQIELPSQLFGLEVEIQSENNELREESSMISCKFC